MRIFRNILRINARLRFLKGYKFVYSKSVNIIQLVSF